MQEELPSLIFKDVVITCHADGANHAACPETIRVMRKLKEMKRDVIAKACDPSNPEGLEDYCLCQSPSDYFQRGSCRTTSQCKSGVYDVLRLMQSYPLQADIQDFFLPTTKICEPLNAVEIHEKVTGVVIYAGLAMVAVGAGGIGVGSAVAAAVPGSLLVNLATWGVGMITFSGIVVATTLVAQQ